MTKEELGIPAAVDALWVEKYRESQAKGTSVSSNTNTLAARRLAGWMPA